MSRVSKGTGCRDAAVEGCGGSCGVSGGAGGQEAMPLAAPEHIPTRVTDRTHNCERRALTRGVY